MDWLAKGPDIIAWARKHILLAVFAMICGIFAFAAYSFIGGYMTTFGATFAGSYSRFTKSVASYTIIDTMLHDFMMQFNASRIGIGRFHNSVHDTGEHSLFYVSFEQVLSAPGVSSDLNTVANLPATMFSQVLPSMLDQKAIMLHTNSIEQSPLKELLVKRGTKVVLFVPVRDLSDKLVGMITLDWLWDSDVPSGPDQQAMIKTLTDAAVRIGGYYSAVSQ